MRRLLFILLLCGIGGLTAYAAQGGMSEGNKGVALRHPSVARILKFLEWAQHGGKPKLFLHGQHGTPATTTPERPPQHLLEQFPTLLVPPDSGRRFPMAVVHPDPYVTYRMPQIGIEDFMVKPEPATPKSETSPHPDTGRNAEPDRKSAPSVDEKPTGPGVPLPKGEPPHPGSRD